ncbi:hypothetical protein ASA1KI_45960 [Opitutales bacterium ASA1]|uniref:nucleotidyl transferase AbiEii/AbiGii toxin family protein n=1 Tax=Congregicoccus parvus TaxID=3081749 RepID=UPI002B2AE3E9|nr:hypothetical protein ASA1KI_45960 [Opitutales bacterium ASA1]
MKLSSLEAIFRALNDAGSRYLVVGGLAVIAHGYLRFTQDLDLVVSLDDANIRNALRALETLGYRPKVPVRMSEFADPATRESWIREKQMLVFQLVSDLHPTVAIDLFVEEPFPFDVEWHKAATQPLAPGASARVVSLPTLLALKRAADRPNDRIDIDMLSRQHGLSHE